jgi:hypothetical protein
MNISRILKSKKPIYNRTLSILEMLNSAELPSKELFF